MSVRSSPKDTSGVGGDFLAGAANAGWVTSVKGANAAANSAVRLGRETDDGRATLFVFATVPSDEDASPRTMSFFDTRGGRVVTRPPQVRLFPATVVANMAAAR